MAGRDLEVGKLIKLKRLALIIFVVTAVIQWLEIIFSHRAFASPESNYIEFGGTLWSVKMATINSLPVPPGNNYFSDNWGQDESVFVDERGRLHLAITRQNETWLSAEVATVLPAGPGQYRFKVLLPNSPPLDPHVAVAIFLYADDEHEIDIELSKFLSRHDGRCASCNIQYVLQPFDIEGNWRKFTWPDEMRESVHDIKWFPSGDVRLSSFLSIKDNWPVISEIFQLSPKKLPSGAGYRLHLSIWLKDGRIDGVSNAPENRDRQEVIFESLALPDNITEMTQ